MEAITPKLAWNERTGPWLSILGFSAQRFNGAKSRRHSQTLTKWAYIVLMHCSKSVTSILIIFNYTRDNVLAYQKLFRKGQRNTVSPRNGRIPHTHSLISICRPGWACRQLNTVNQYSSQGYHTKCVRLSAWDITRGIISWTMMRLIIT